MRFFFFWANQIARKNIFILVRILFLFSLHPLLKIHDPGCSSTGVSTVHQVTGGEQWNAFQPMVRTPHQKVSGGASERRPAVVPDALPLPQLIGDEDDPPLQHGGGEHQQDLPVAQTAAQRGEVHMLQPGVQRPRQLDDLEEEEEEEEEEARWSCHHMLSLRPETPLSLERLLDIQLTRHPAN